MRKRHIIIAGLIVTLVGIITITASLFNHPSTTLIWNQHGLQIYRSANKTTDLKSFKNVQLDTSGYDVKIQHGTKFSIKSETSNAHVPTATVKDGTLTLSTTAPQYSTVFNVDLSGTSFRTPTIVITIPNDASLTSIAGSTDNGSLSLSDVTTESINLQLNSSYLLADNLVVQNNGQLSSSNSNITVKNSNLASTSVTSSTGDIDILNSTLTGGLYKTTNGNLKVNNTHVNQLVTIENNHGNITTDNATMDGYQLTVQNGTLSVFGKNQSGNYSSNATATNRLNVQVDNGNITIK